MSDSHRHASDRMGLGIIACLAAWTICGPAAARGQVPGFFNPGAAAYEPEIGVVNTGIIHDVQATVSADRRYVTLTVRDSNAKLLALNEFAFGHSNGVGAVSGAKLGFVGGVHFSEDARGFAAGKPLAKAGPSEGTVGTSAGGLMAEPMLNPPVHLREGSGTALLLRRGMTRLNES